jgi:hypothetical protein
MPDVRRIYRRSKMIKKMIMVVSIGVVVFFSSICYADGKSIFLAGVNLRIGMTKDKVFNSIGSPYKVKPIGKNDLDSFIITKIDDDKYDSIGMITFTNDKLSWISRDWGSYHNEAHDLGEALYGVLDALIKECGETAIITSQTQRAPGMTFNTINITVGTKTIILLISSGKDAGNSVGIQETIK